LPLRLLPLSLLALSLLALNLLSLRLLALSLLSLRLLPHAYGLREPSRAWQAFIFWGVNGSILAGVVLFINPRMRAISASECWAAIFLTSSTRSGSSSTTSTSGGAIG